MLHELKSKAFDAHIEVLKLQDTLKKAEQYYVECLQKALDAEKESLPKALDAEKESLPSNDE